MSIWGGRAGGGGGGGGGGGEEARAYSCTNGCGEGCKAKNRVLHLKRWGPFLQRILGLEKIRKHIRKAASSPESGDAGPCWIQQPHFLPHPAPGKGHLGERSPLRRGLWGGPGAPCSRIPRPQGPGGRDAGITAPAGTARAWRPQRLSRQLGADVTRAPGRSGPSR